MGGALTNHHRNGDWLTPYNSFAMDRVPLTQASP